VKEIVIIPAWRRPEFLKAALTRLLRADDGRPEYWICLDRGHFATLVPVIAWFKRRLGHRVRVGQRMHNYKGNSYNVIMSYRDALAEGADLVHLVEEDILVGADYFDFHRRAHDLVPDAFSVSSCRNQQFIMGHEPPGDETAVWRHSAYQSLGVSFKAERLKAVLPHARSTYFAQPVTYCRRHFPHTAINPNNAEQDGLLHRLSENAGLSSVYPAVPRAYHAGFSGYHRKGKLPPGGVDARADRILAMTAEEMNERAGSYPDHATVPLDGFRLPVDRVITWP
jgi:hypothetical protein